MGTPLPLVVMIQRPADVDDDRERVALDCLTAGITAADPATAVAERLSLSDDTLCIDGDHYDLAAYEDVYVIGGGNAAGVLAAATEDVLGEHLTDGAVVTDNPVETDRVAVLPGDHPVPSGRGVEGAERVLELARRADAADLVIGVITGGGSALLPAPADGLDLAALQGTTEAVLASGADIGEFNAIRKHCSAIKGGQLARAAHPATVVGLLVSDVIGNRLDVIASGPLTPDTSTYADALSVLERYDVDAPDAVWAWLRAGADGELPETPSPGDPVFEAVTQYILADAMRALEGAAAAASDAGYDPLILSSRVRGEASEAAKVLAGVAEEAAATGTPVEPPAVVLTGGETTVTVTGDGWGGPNQEFALSAAVELENPTITVASADTDGIDGGSDAAGGVATAEDVAAVTEEARAALATNDAGGFLDEHGGLIVTGPTNTNVNDLRAFVVPAAE